MKIRSYLELQDFLDRESSWRKQELVFLRLEMKIQKDKKADFFIRSSIALSYAHLEGFVKRSSEAFWVYLSNMQLKRNEVASPLLNSYLLCRSLKNGELKNTSAFSKFLEDAFNFQCEEPLEWEYKKLVKTRSNLKYEVFKEILFNIGLNTKPYDLKEKKLNALVELRNSIAHGDKPRVNSQEAIEFVEIVQQIIDGIKTDIMNLICTNGFKKNPELNNNFDQLGGT